MTITKNDIYIAEEILVNDPPRDNSINVEFECLFDPSERFHIELDEEEYIDLYVDYYPKTHSIKGLVVCHGAERNDEFIFYPTQEEKEMFIQYIEDYIQRHEGVSVVEFVDREKKFA